MGRNKVREKGWKGKGIKSEGRKKINKRNRSIGKCK
jgi:hypothetical protein